MKSKRKMPAHIVLPNGMWRFVKSGTKKASAAVKRVVKRRRTKTRVVKMAKRRRTSKRSFGGMGGGKLMNGFYSPKGIIAKALIGAAAAEVSDASGINVIPYQSLAVAGVVGGLPGVAGAMALNMLQGKGVKTSSGSGFASGY